MDPKLIFANKDILVVYKPAGLLVHAGAGQERARIVRGKGMKTGKKKEVAFHIEVTLVDWLLAHYPEIKTVGDKPEQRPGIVHRLDKETSGIMVVARNQVMFEYLKARFMAHEMIKTYHAIVFGTPKNAEGTIDLPIGIKNGTLKRSVRSTKMKKEAITAYKILKSFRAVGPKGDKADFSLLEVCPKTGRTHQIRVHLGHMGHAVVGDPLYGPSKQPSWATRLMLEAVKLAFKMPDGKTATFETEEELEKIIKAARRK